MLAAADSVNLFIISKMRGSITLDKKYPSKFSVVYNKKYDKNKNY